MTAHLSLRLAEHLASRFCHDLITPIGAINTGLELFQESPSAIDVESKDILNLISNSAQIASARLSFFRTAYGSSSVALSLGDAKQLVENYFLRTKMTFDWGELFDEKTNLGGWGKLLLGSILWLSECAPRGGLISLSPLQANIESFSLKLKADSIIIHQGTIEALQGKISLDELTPRTISCYVLHLLIEEKKGTISVVQTKNPSELNLILKGI
jgi:histidine phosphotransferase ChpT